MHEAHISVGENEHSQDEDYMVSENSQYCLWVVDDQLREVQVLASEHLCLTFI